MILAKSKSSTLYGVPNAGTQRPSLEPHWPTTTAMAHLPSGVLFSKSRFTNFQLSSKWCRGKTCAPCVLVAGHSSLHCTTPSSELNLAGPNAGAFALAWTQIPECRDNYDCWYLPDWPWWRWGGVKIPLSAVDTMQKYRFPLLASCRVVYPGTRICLH